MKLKEYENAFKHTEKAIESYRKALVPIEEMIYIRANIERRLGRYEAAQRDYQSIAALFRRNEN